MRFKIALFILLVSHFSYAQRTCGTMDFLKDLQANDESIQENRTKIEEFTINFIQSNAHTKNGRNVIRIPVVVHVVYRTAEENISEAQIRSQIDVLNEDFRRTNSNASQTPSLFVNVAADTEIEFCLATRDPFGNISNGITRTQTTVNSFPINNAVKQSSLGGVNSWNTSNYLNIWVCNLTSPFLGFGTLPGSVQAPFDGVVITYKHFGRTPNVLAPYNKGRTATHEVGHYLNLLHTWGDDEGSADNCAGTDQVSDTPNQASPNFGCPNFPKSSCGNTSDMFMNFMDYTDDVCMNIFTQGQKMRMLAVLNGFRSSLQVSNGCSTDPVPQDCDTLTNIIGADGFVAYNLNELIENSRGYFTGNNSLGFLKLAESFTAVTERAIYAVKADFAYASGTGMFTLDVRAADELTGLPSEILASIEYPIPSVIEDIENFQATWLTLPTPINVTGNYFLTLNLPTTEGDSLALFSNQIDEVNTNTAYYIDNEDVWKSFAIDSISQNGLSLALQPVACLTTSIQEKQNNRLIHVYPNPARDMLIIQTDNQQRWEFSLFSISGNLVQRESGNTLNEHSINVQQLAEGTYILRMSSEKEVHFRKVIIIK